VLTVVKCLAVRDSDHAFLAHLLHCIGNEGTNRDVAVGGDSGNLESTGHEKQCTHVFVHQSVRIMEYERGIHLRAYQQLCVLFSRRQVLRLNRVLIPSQRSDHCVNG
jgi:hypothetical protein